MPKISVIVPVYNVEKYLTRCIDSILSQTFPDFELILIDDGSLDRSSEICDSYAQLDHRIKVVHQSNQGQAAARNHAVAIAKAEWIHFVDSDDLIHPLMLESLYSAVEQTGASIAMCSIYEGEEILDRFVVEQAGDASVYHVDEDYLKGLYTAKDHRYWVVWAKLIRRGIVESVPFTNGRIYEDNAVVCQWLEKSGTVVDLSGRLYFYFVNPKGTTKGAFGVRHRDALWALEQQISFYRSIGYLEMRHLITEEYIARSALMYQRLLAKEDGKKTARDLKRTTVAIWLWEQMNTPIPTNKSLTMFSAFYPRFMNTFWILRHMKQIVKEKGIDALFGKLKARVEKRFRNWWRL